MNSTSSFPKLSVEELGLDKKCKEGRAGSDCYQQNGQSFTRFIVSYGELHEKQLHLLRHPKTGSATLYAIGNERVEELLKFDDGFRSVLLGNNVVSNGSLILFVPVSPVLLLLPYLRKFAKDDYVSLKEILVDDYFPSIKLLENVKAVKSSLKHACHCKEISNIETYKYSESLLMDYIMNKIKLLRKSDHYKSDCDRAVCGILEENLPADILRLVEIDFVHGGNEDAPSNKRRKKTGF
uniref:Ribonuclease H2 subunit B wHTH domain-containing protein n=1 Tax=Wuchereria bancrofti TaxID=6293 RepID=A0AAF5PGL9_WUCBA